MKKKRSTSQLLASPNLQFAAIFITTLVIGFLVAQLFSDQIMQASGLFNNRTEQ